MATSTPRVALVTGANKGIGYYIVDQLARADPALTVLLGSRDPQRGEEAAKALGHANVHPLLLDVSDDASIARAVAEVQSQYGGLDILVNNAGIASMSAGPSAEVARSTLHTNYYGLLSTTRRFLPLLRAHGKILNVSSGMSVGGLHNMSAANRSRFLDPALTVDGLSALLEEFVQDVADGKIKEKGWPGTIWPEYAMSKVGVSILTRILARDMTEGRTINSGCPGYCSTDLNGRSGPRDPADGAKTFSHLALLPSDQTTNGEFWEDSQVSSLTRPLVNEIA